MRQRLVLPNFPRPDMVAMLNPNSGDAHWSEKRAAKATVLDNIVPGLVRQQGISPVRGFAILIPTFVVPDRRARDDDNYATGVLKVTRDALVKLGILQADDSTHLRQCPVNFEVAPGQRALRIDLLSASDLAFELLDLAHRASDDAVLGTPRPVADLLVAVLQTIDPTLAMVVMRGDHPERTDPALDRVTRVLR